MAVQALSKLNGTRTFKEASIYQLELEVSYKIEEKLVLTI